MSSKREGHYVYTLDLEGGNKYVGISKHLDSRLSQHFEGKGAAWTKKHAPLRVHHSNWCRSETAAKNAERIIVERMKNYYGSDKVRGAGHTSSK